MAIGDSKKLFEFIDRLPAAHRLEAEGTLRRQLQRKTATGQPRFTVAQQRIANRLPITPATGMMHNARSLRRLSISGRRSERRASARPVFQSSPSAAPVLSAGAVRPSAIGGRAHVRYSSFASELFAGDKRRLPSGRQSIAELALLSAPSNVDDHQCAEAAALDVEDRQLPATPCSASASGAGVRGVGVRTRSMRSVSAEPRLSPIEETERSA